MVEFKKQFQFESLTVADSAFYTQENLQIAKEVKWLSRVPVTVKDSEEFSRIGRGKRVKSESTYGLSFSRISTKLCRC